MSDWLKLLLLGILSVVFGIVILGAPVVASVAITTLTGILLLIGGGAQIVGGFTVEGAWGKIFAIIMGIVMALLGWSFLSNPLAGTLSLAMVVMILFAAGGIARIILSFQMRGTQLFWPTLISGLLSLALAVYIFSNATAGLALSLLGILMGIEMLFNGFGLIFAAFFVKRNGPTAQQPT
ncbi:HdeD family acid-resistance protein [Lutimaribacter marinistellae]|uniref:HdeD family acid-resistance protein n=1 Tax=Lutimaribacter marinistellae TaxID=1820329 RepID=A0ABV7TBX3_9RHOB